ncbi:hypothetical protein ABZ642_33250 [Streptomyces sp. NPDC007157]|uniref:hypothetical protein n=1 Tax=Streptomyces sp. NPDC007157 TaxID=3154681 RepID=UPI0033C1C277
MGDEAGYVSRLAGQIESRHLGMAGDLLDHAAELLAEQRLTGEELRYLARRPSESLRRRACRREQGCPVAAWSLIFKAWCRGAERC